ncbi:hypothetical protein J3D54_005364 [Pseudomonas sp. GGS8]|nr:hypothetical protein [Pseudomonas sp. GGS8]
MATKQPEWEAIERTYRMGLCSAEPLASSTAEVIAPLA